MIQRARSGQIYPLLKLAQKLWPNSGTLYEEMKEYLIAEEKAAFLFWKQTSPVGLALCSLRSEYVEGTNDSPVGYLEGIYVEEDFRGKNIAAALLSSCEEWAKQRGCREFASDCELDNPASLAFHLHTGFEEANRIICFVKTL